VSERTVEAFRRTIEIHWKLLADLAPCLDDEGGEFSVEGLNSLRRRVANALPPDMCPEWLAGYRDGMIVQSGE
jgi:hypothetical protein